LIFFLGKICSKLDEHNSGTVSFENFQNAVFDSLVILPQRVAEVLLLEADINEMGRIEYMEALEIPFEVFVEADKTHPLQFPLIKPRIQIHGMMQDEFVKTFAGKLEEFEVNSKTGTIQRASLRNALHDPVWDCCYILLYFVVCNLL
jgi:hypothetical protein